MSHAEPFYHLSTGLISIGLAGSKCPIGPQLPQLTKKKKKAYLINLCVERKKMVGRQIATIHPKKKGWKYLKFGQIMIEGGVRFGYSE
jgi:hypothetical protein